MKYFIYTIHAIIIVLFLNSCGSSDTQEGGAFTLPNTVIVINCDGTGTGLNDCINYTCLNNNDTLVSNNDDTLLEIIHTSNGNKKVCVKLTVPAGSAHIQR